MSADCCAHEQTSVAPKCPGNGMRGRAVEWRTVAALTTGPVPPRRDFWLCLDRDCDIVYFSENGHYLGTGELRFEAGIKSASPEAFLCYCFLHRRREFLSERLRAGGSTLVSQIATAVKAGNCACDVRNPTGRCCLGEIKKELGVHSSS